MPIVVHCYRCRQYIIPELMSYQFKGPRSCCLGRRAAYCRDIAWNSQNISYEKALPHYFLLSHSPYLVLIYNIFLNKSVVSPLAAVCMKTAVQGRRNINACFLSPHSMVKISEFDILHSTLHCVAEISNHYCELDQLKPSNSSLLYFSSILISSSNVSLGLPLRGHSFMT